MATQEMDGAARSFRIDRILGVTATQRTFVPRYPVKLTPNGPVSIPQSLSLAASSTPLRPIRRAASTGPSYILGCPVCRKEFSRRTYDAELRADNPYDLIRRYTLSEPDRSIIRQHRGAANRLGFAVQLCYLPSPGVVLGANELPFAPLLHLVAINSRFRLRLGPTMEIVRGPDTR
jgi:hypothetical protein